LKYLKKMIFH